jgi:hypothetical protein
MTNFHVGQKVVCVSTHGETKDAISLLSRGTVYTIGSIHEDGPHIGLCLNEVPVIAPFIAYWSGLFRAVAEKRAAMDIIRAIVLDPSKPIPVDPREPKVIPVPEYHPDMGRI